MLPIQSQLPGMVPGVSQVHNKHGHVPDQLATYGKCLEPHLTCVKACECQLLFLPINSFIRPSHHPVP